MVSPGVANTPSLHDHLLVRYDVDCELRKIQLTSRRPDWAGGGGCRVQFTEVQGYSLKDDAFGNILHSLTEVRLSEFLLDHRSELAAAYSRAGSPGSWAGDLSTARDVLTSEGVRAFILSGSYGLSGWVLAKTLEWSNSYATQVSQ